MVMRVSVKSRCTHASLVVPQRLHAGTPSTRGAGSDSRATARVAATATLTNHRAQGWTADESKFMAGLPGALPPMGNFDPAGFTEGKSVAELKMLREAEVTHGRVSMLASLGFLVQESFHPLFRLGDKDIGPAIRHLDEVRAEVPIFFEILVLGIGFAEISRSLAGWTAPAGSNPADGPLANLPDDTPFRRLEDKYYPGDIGFDPAGLKPSDPKEFAVRGQRPCLFALTRSRRWRRRGRHRFYASRAQPSFSVRRRWPRRSSRTAASQ